jgi:NADPH-dependent ferric siderophore reductase
VNNDDEHYPLPEREGVDLRWIYRPDGLLAAAQGLALLPEPGYAWIAAESAEMRAVRKHLLDERGWPADQLYGAGYWKAGQPDHDDEH